MLETVGSLLLGSHAQVCLPAHWWCMLNLGHINLNPYGDANQKRSLLLFSLLLCGFIWMLLLVFLVKSKNLFFCRVSSIFKCWLHIWKHIHVGWSELAMVCRLLGRVNGKWQKGCVWLNMFSSLQRVNVLYGSGLERSFSNFRKRILRNQGAICLSVQVAPRWIANGLTVWRKIREIG